MQELAISSNSYNQTPRQPRTPEAGVADLSNGVVYDIFTIPPVFSFTAVSNNGGGGGTVTIYIFNVSNMTAPVTDNGSGAASIVNTYGDNAAGNGKIYDAMISSWGDGRGVLIKAFTVQATTTSTGDQTATPFNTLSLQVLNANGQGGNTPVPIDVNAALRNTQFQIGVLTVRSNFRLNAINQLSCRLPLNTTLAFTFTTENGSL